MTIPSCGTGFSNCWNALAILRWWDMQATGMRQNG